MIKFDILKYLKNTSWLYFGQIFKMSISFILMVFLSRYLGPENFGIISYSQGFVAIFTAFVSLGLDSILVRELTIKRVKCDTIIGTALILKALAAIIAIVFILLLNMNADDQTAALFTNIISITLIIQIFNTFDVFFQANVISKYTVISHICTSLLSSILKFYLIFTSAEIIFFVYALIFDAIIMSLGYIIIYTGQNQKLTSLCFDKETAKRLLQTGWPLTLVALASFIYTRTDQIMIKHMIDNKSVGNYAAAIKISELFYFIPILLSQSIFPKIIEVRERSEVEYLSLLQQCFKISVWCVLPITIGIFCFSDIIVKIIFGGLYTEAAGILSLLSLTVVFTAVGTISTKILYAEGFEKKYLYRSLLGVFLNIVLNYYLISAYGPQGAAIATILTLFSIYYLYDIFDKDLRKFYYLKLKCFIPPKIRVKG